MRKINNFEAKMLQAKNIQEANWHSDVRLSFQYPWRKYSDKSQLLSQILHEMRAAELEKFFSFGWNVHRNKSCNILN